MAVMSMKRINIYGLNNDRKSILELLQRKACVEILDSPDDEDKIFSKTDVSTLRSTFEANQKALQGGIDILNKYVEPEKRGMFAGRENLSSSKYSEIEANFTGIAKNAGKIVKLNKEIADLNADIFRNKASIEALVPWENLDISMRIKETESTAVFLGTLPGEFDEKMIKQKLAIAVPNAQAVDVEIISSSVQQTCIFVISHKKVCGNVEEALRSIGFSYPTSLSKTSPKERIIILGDRIKAAEKEISEKTEKIISFKTERDNLLAAYDYLIARVEKYEALGKILASNKTFCINGFVTEADSLKVKEKLEQKFSCLIEIENPLDTDDVPVKLKNGGFAAPVENIVESYSLPKKGEIDPSPILAIFYYALFGLMFSDLGYGLIMIIGCSVVLAKNKNMEQGMKSSMKMFLYCGISTAFWGLMFGSFFGDIITVVGQTFFNATWTTPTIWYNPIDGPMTLLMFSLALGVIHLFTGLGIKFHMLVKAGQVKDAIFDVLFWYFLVGGGIIYFMSMQMFADISGLGFTLPPVAGTIAAVFAGIGAIGIVFTSGRASRSPVVKLMKGLYGLYGATSYLSDILSYSRLLALGLATGVIASVFNQIAAMGGPNVVGVIMFILVFAAGHGLNFGLNVLGAYVHSNRLEYVEFFGKFYEGGGKKFNPFSAKTKYYKIMEE